MMKYRESAEVERTPMSHETSRKLEMTWTAIAIIIVVLLMIASYPVLIDLDHDTQESQADAEVFVVGVQFEWSYTLDGVRYKTDPINKTSDMELQTGLRYKFVVRGSGAIHSFFVPDLNFKVDAVPGRNNSIVIEITKPGTYQVWCNEYCGLLHSEMISSFKVV
jgi:cytochrome c oxidase subunit 2